jgi:hypothetical protein
MTTGPRTIPALRWRLPLLLVCLWVGAMLLPSDAQAEPRFAMREGVACAMCHVNQTGGGMRTNYGVSYAQSNLAMAQEPGPFLPQLGESVAVGANLRVANRTTLAAHTKLQGKRYDSETSNSFEMGEGNIYLRLDAIPEKLTIYIDETVAPEAASAREAFVLLEMGEQGLYLKGGRFMLPYGLRIPDDAAFIRQETGFTYADQDLGVEIGINHHPVLASLAVSNGSGGGADPNLAKQVTGTVAYGREWARLGVSAAYNDTSTPDMTFRSITSGVHAGVRLGRLVELVEIDWVHGIDPLEPYDQIPFYAETSFEVAQGAFLRFVFEAYDPLLALEENEKDRFTWGVSLFPMQLLEVRAEYRLRRDIPQLVDGNADEVFVELHGFL